MFGYVHVDVFIWNAKVVLFPMFDLNMDLKLPNMLVEHVLDLCKLAVAGLLELSMIAGTFLEGIETAHALIDPASHLFVVGVKVMELCHDIRELISSATIKGVERRYWK